MIRQVDLPNFEDERGRFSKLFDQKNEHLINFNIRQINHVTTKQRSTLRGLHYQTDNFLENKLFKVLKGEIQLAAFCVEKTSANYLKTFSFILNPEKKQFLIPKGYATGYLVLERNSEVIYCSDNIYNPEMEKGIRWNDPVISIKWQTANPILSEKDKNWPDFIC